MMGWAQAFNAEGMKRMARYFERLKVEDDTAKAKAAKPCELSGGAHRWQYSHGDLTGSLIKHCNCGARG
jgi:hypothetical protein